LLRRQDSNLRQID